MHPSSIEQQLSDRPLSNQISPASVAHRLKSLITSFVDSRTRVNVSADLERLLRQLEAQTEEAASFLANHRIRDAPAWRPLSNVCLLRRNRAEGANTLPGPSSGPNAPQQPSITSASAGGFEHHHRSQQVSYNSQRQTACSPTVEARSGAETTFPGVLSKSRCFFLACAIPRAVSDATAAVRLAMRHHERL